jgi:lysyl-tRNA synthetase class 2
MTDQMLPDTAVLSVDEQIAQRQAKLAQLRQRGPAYPNFFKRDALAAELHDRYDAISTEELEQVTTLFKVAGRIMLKRIMGKVSFLTIQDMSGRIQLYLKQDHIGVDIFEDTKTWDIGDIIGVEGAIFKTKTGELSLRVEHIHLLTKALRPLPDKFHGLTDHEARYRQRYLDLLMNENTRRVFAIRSQMIIAIREFLMQHQFIEVETPMMQLMAGGAAAKPFTTHHNALGLDLFLRIAPELYLKRLVVGGFEKVFEINRNFRNEGLSTRHNPEFTMLEFYQAYADYHDLMDFTEKMMRAVALKVLGTTSLNYQGMAIDFAQPFKRMTIVESILAHNPTIERHQLLDYDAALALSRQLGIPGVPNAGLGKIQVEIFDKTVEEKLLQPTFITAYPSEVSPLARANDQDPTVTDRFELFIAGREMANGFSELNDPEDQAARFRAQQENKRQGDEETMPYDEDYIKALEYGLPPTAGEGIGIDRLAMLLSDQPSIRDVLLFPHMRPV